MASSDGLFDWLYQETQLDAAEELINEQIISDAEWEEQWGEYMMTHCIKSVLLVKEDGAEMMIEVGDLGVAEVVRQSPPHTGTSFPE